MTADSELLHRYANDRSEEAFAALVQRHLTLVYFAALRRTNGNTHLAEDVTQIVFTALAQNARSLQGHTVLAAWLYVTTRHAAANAMRTEQRLKAREQEAHIMQESSASPVTEGTWNQLRPELDSVLDELNDADRDAVLLRFFGNRPYAEIGTNLGISEDAARRRVDRALEKMRALLGQRGISSTAAALAGLMATQSALAAPAGLAAAVTGTALLGGTAVTTAAGAATATELFTLMTTNKILAGIAGAVAFVAAGTAVYEANEVHQTHAELARLNQERDTLRQHLQEQSALTKAADEKSLATEKRYAALEKSRMETESAGRAGSAAGQGRSGSAAKSAPAAPFVNKMDILFSNPEYAQLELKRFATTLGHRYGPLYNKLGLSPEQISEFEGLLVEQQQALMDVLAAARSSGVSVNDPGLRRLNDPGYAASDAKMRTLLGSAGYAAYKAWNDPTVGMARSSADMLAMNLYYTEAPLTALQGEQLTQIIAANTAKPSGSGFMLESKQPDWTTIYAQAKDILSPGQLAELQKTNESSQLAFQLSALADKLLMQSAAAATPPKS